MRFVTFEEWILALEPARFKAATLVYFSIGRRLNVSPLNRPCLSLRDANTLFQTFRKNMTSTRVKQVWETLRDFRCRL
jgi:hypothetical protein